MELYDKKKISIIVEKVYKDKVIFMAEQAGASGFTVYKNIVGHGKSGSKKDFGSLSDMSGNVEIVIISSNEVADKVVLGLKNLLDEGISLIVHLFDVKVIRDEHFY